jgi:hypothetical protein
VCATKKLRTWGVYLLVLHHGIKLFYSHLCQNKTKKHIGGQARSSAKAKRTFDIIIELDSKIQSPVTAYGWYSSIIVWILMAVRNQK